MHSLIFFRYIKNFIFSSKAKISISINDFLTIFSMYSNLFELKSYFYPLCFRLCSYFTFYWMLSGPEFALNFNEKCSFLSLYWVQWNFYIKRYRSRTWLVSGWNPHLDVRFANHVPYLRLRSWNQRPALHRPLLPDTNAKNRPTAIKTRCACAHRLWLDWFPSVNIRQLVFLSFHALSSCSTRPRQRHLRACRKIWTNQRRSREHAEFPERAPSGFRRPAF